MSSEKTKNVEAIKEVKIEYTLDKNLPYAYTDNSVVQNRDFMFFLSFLKNNYPVSLTEEDLRQIDKITTSSVAHLTMTPTVFARTIDAMAQNFEKFLQTIGAEPTNYKDYLNNLGKLEKDELPE